MSDLPDTIYIGTWCSKEETTLKEFFNWYFRNSLKFRKDYPQNLTDTQWFEQYRKYREIRHGN